VENRPVKNEESESEDLKKEEIEINYTNLSPSIHQKT